MKLSASATFSLLLTGLLLAGSVSAQTKKPPQKKPPVSSGAKGTTQLAGDNGKFNVDYTIGKTGAVNIVLTAAEYTVSRLNIGENPYIPKAGEKLLLLKYSIQNPNPVETQYDWSTLKFTAVGEDNGNHEFVGAVAKQGTSDVVSIGLKPGQKILLTTGILVPAKGVIPKLLVEHVNGGRILRYDLTGQIKGLLAPFADPADKSGGTSRAEVPAAANIFLPLGRLDAKFLSGEFAAGPLGDAVAEDGKRFFVATLTLKNLATTPTTYDTSVPIGKLETADGETLEMAGLLKTKLNETASGDLAPNAEYTVRYYFLLSKDAKVKTFRLAENESHTLAVDVSTVK